MPFNELVHLHPSIQFRLLRDVREPGITGAVGQKQIEILNHLTNGRFMEIDKEDRLNFELIYTLIVDLRERNLESDLASAFKVVINELSDYWLIQLLQS